jgi:hypothetical protein
MVGMEGEFGKGTILPIRRDGTEVLSKKFPLPSHYMPLQQGYPVTQQHLHTNVGISALEPIVTHGFNVHDLAVVSEGSEVRDNYSISAYLCFRPVSRTIRKGLAIFKRNKPPRRRKSTIKRSRNGI